MQIHLYSQTGRNPFPGNSAQTTYNPAFANETDVPEQADYHEQIFAARRGDWLGVGLRRDFRLSKIP